MKFKILGQEPVTWVLVIESFLALLLTFGIPGLDQDLVGAVMAVVAGGFGFVQAWVTKTTAFSALIQAVKAALFLAVTLGAPLTDAQTGATIALISVVAGLYLRDRTASVETAISSASPGAALTPVNTVVVNAA